MERLFGAVFLLLVICPGRLPADEFPIFLHNDPYTMDTSRVDIDTAFSQAAEFGGTHIMSWGTPLTIQKAQEYGLKLIINNKYNSVFWRDPIQYPDPYGRNNNVIEIFNSWPRGIEENTELSLYLDMEVENDKRLNGYFFEINNSVGEKYNVPGFSGCRCIVSEHSTGYLFDRLGWVSNDSVSVFGYMSKDTDADICNADFYLKIPSLSNPELPVCRIEVLNFYNHIDSLFDSTTIFVGDFAQIDTFEVFTVNFPQAVPNKSIWLKLRLYWYDNVDLYVDKVLVYNPKGNRFFNGLSSDSLDSKIEAYFDGLGNYQSCTHSYYLDDEPYLGCIPAVKYANDRLKAVTSPATVPGFHTLGWGFNDIMVNDVYAYLVNPPAMNMDYYWYLCGMPLNSDTTIDCFRRICDYNLQRNSIKDFAKFLDTSYLKASRYGKEFWYTFQAGSYVYYNGGNPYLGYEDPTEEALKLSVYMGLAHGAKGLGVYTYGSDAPADDLHMPDYEPYFGGFMQVDDQRGGRECECPMIASDCYNPDYEFRAHGLFDWDYNRQTFIRNEKWYFLKDILARVKVMGSILRECDLLDVGLVDSQSVGFIDSVSGIFDPNWIEAAVFSDGSEYYIMLVNRRLLESEINTVKVFLNKNQFEAPAVLEDVYSGLKYIYLSLKPNQPPFFTVTLNPGEGRLFRYEIEDIACGDINVDGHVNVSDAVELLNYIFAKGLPPGQGNPADTNCDGGVNISDVIELIRYVFLGDPLRCDPNGDGINDC